LFAMIDLRSRETVPIFDQPSLGLNPRA